MDTCTDLTPHTTSTVGLLQFSFRGYSSEEKKYNYVRSQINYVNTAFYSKVVLPLRPLSFVPYQAFFMIETANALKIPSEYNEPTLKTPSN